jgi:hypothetical protein
MLVGLGVSKKIAFVITLNPALEQRYFWLCRTPPAPSAAAFFSWCGTSNLKTSAAPFTLELGHAHEDCYPP